MALYIGANYHPHDWEESRWEYDFKLMKEAGFTTVRLGHLCWDSYEPEDGVYTFEWFDKVMDLCEKYELGVVLDVSMHPAPIWVHKKCPGCNIGGKNGDHQAPLRRYADDVSDAEYQFYALRFAETIVNRYKNHPALFAFGLCNELGAGYPSYSEESRQRFVEWLKEKYGTIEVLNKKWATQRWSRRLSCFEDVAFQVNEIGVGAPEAWLDMRRFFAEGISDFITKLKNTVEINAPGIPHSSNHYAEYDSLGFDYQRTYEDFVDYAGIGFYPGYGKRTDLSFDIKSVWYMARLAETQKPMWCLEFVTGGVGIQSASYGLNRMYIFWCLMHRAQMFLGWTWRSMLNGEEQFLYGMLNHDGRTNSNYLEFKKTAEDLKKLEKYAFPYVPEPEIAIALSYDNKWMTEYHPRQFRQSYDAAVGLASRVVERKNLDYNVVDLHNLKGNYKLLILPNHIIMDEKSAETVRTFVENGGTVIMTGYSAIMTENGGVFDISRPGRVDDVFGVRIDGSWRCKGLEVPEEVEKNIVRNPETGLEILNVELAGEKTGRSFNLEVEYIENITLEGAECFMQETTHNVCAVSKHHYGKGTAYYVFCETNDVILEKVLEEIREEVGLKTTVSVPDGILVREIAENQMFFLNITGKDISIPLEKSGYRVLRDEKVSEQMILKAYDGDLVEFIS